MKMFSYPIASSVFPMGVALFVCACTMLKVTEPKKAGYFPHTGKAITTKAVATNLDTMNTLLVVQNSSFLKGMATNLGYFQEVISVEELEKRIIEANKQDEIGNLSGLIGLNKAFHHYTPFLYLKWGEGAPADIAQLKLVHPGLPEELLVTEKQIGNAWQGGSDQTVTYPLFNALVDYIKENSATYLR